MAKEPQLCRSGSGALALRGTFAPGGDAKYKSQLIARVIDGPLSKEDKETETKRLTQLGYDESHLRDHASEFMTVKRAEQTLEDLGWTKFLDKKRETIAAKESKAAERAAARAEKAEAAKVAKAEKATKAKAAKAAKAKESVDA